MNWFKKLFDGQVYIPPRTPLSKPPAPPAPPEFVGVPSVFVQGLIRSFATEPLAWEGGRRVGDRYWYTHDKNGMTLHFYDEFNQAGLKSTHVSCDCYAFEKFEMKMLRDSLNQYIILPNAKRVEEREEYLRTMKRKQFEELVKSK